MALFKRILGGERKNHRWVSGHLELGQRKEREREIAEQIAKFKQRMDREGVVFREDRDAWEAYWQQYPRAHMDLVGASVDEVLGEKAYQVFKSFWQRVSKPAIVRFEGDGVIASAPTLVTIGQGENRARVNPVDLLRVTDLEQRALGVVQVDQTIARLDKDIATRERSRDYWLKIRTGLESGAVAVDDPNTGEVIVQGLLGEGMGDDDAE
jgi:hypothetical protein